MLQYWRDGEYSRFPLDVVGPPWPRRMDSNDDSGGVIVVNEYGHIIGMVEKQQQTTKPMKYTMIVAITRSMPSP